jgi:phospholipase C
MRSANTNLRRYLLGGAAMLGVLALAGVGRIAATSSSPTIPASKLVAAATPHVSPATKIKHVVVIYQENNSFDETLGRFCQLHAGRCDGYIGPVHLEDGTVVEMKPAPDIVPDVYHDVHSQDVGINGGAMNGWNGIIGCRAVDGYKCLTYYTPPQIPNLTSLADKFVVSDRTFSMADSPSWGGHVYAAAATLDHFTGDNPLPEAGVVPGPAWGCDSNKLTDWVDPVTHQTSSQPSCIPAQPGTLNPTTYPYNGAFMKTEAQWVPTIFDRLDAANRTWKLYSAAGSIWSICPSFAECEYGPQHVNVVQPTQILTDAQANKLPAYSVLLPGFGNTSQHNGNSMLAGDNWIGQVVSTISNSPSWSSTVVFITYDDFGGFYDHVKPGTNPDGTRQGVRSPMVIVSPFAKVGYTDSQPATFASILKFTEETFSLPALSINDQNAYDYSDSFDFTAPGTGPRVTLGQHAVPKASLHYVATHPFDLNDPT